LRESRCAEASRDCAGEEHERGVGERGNDANGEERCAESVSNEPGEKADERRLIDVTPIEMLTAGEVVKLVAKVAVLRDADEMNENGERGEHCYHRRNAVWPHSAARWRARRRHLVGHFICRHQSRLARSIAGSTALS